MKKSLKERLERYLRQNPAWIANGSLQRLVAEKTTYTPRTTARRLEELVNDGILEVKYVKGHAWYRAKTTQTFSTKAKDKDTLSSADSSYWEGIKETPEERRNKRIKSPALAVVSGDSD